jgi:hypothetical protein
MSNKEQPSRLQDIINYDPDTYLSEEEVALLRTTFKDNPRLIKLLRKLMVPSVGDAELPVEEMGNDAWMTMRDWAQVPADEAKILMVARQEAIKFIFGGIIKIKMLANSAEESPFSKEIRRKQDSTK